MHDRDKESPHPRPRSPAGIRALQPAGPAGERRDVQSPSQRREGAREEVPPRPTLRRIWRALRTPQPDERPPGVPKLRYPIPLGWAFAMGRDMILGRPRSFRADCALAVRVLPRLPVVEGLEHVPRVGPFVIVANHYQRRDLWIGYPGGLLCHSLWSVRDDLTCHFVTTDRAIVDGATVPLTPLLFARVARVWDMVLVTPPEALDADHEGSQRRALRRCLGLLRHTDGPSAALIIYPEGLHGSTRGLLPASPGSGRSLLALAATGAPLLPAAVWEELDGALHLRFGPSWRPTPPAGLPKAELDAWSSGEALRRVAKLLPDRQRGTHGAGCATETPRR